jgi:hypothetical protein
MRNLSFQRVFLLLSLWSEEREAQLEYGMARIAFLQMYDLSIPTIHYSAIYPPGRPPTRPTKLPLRFIAAYGNTTTAKAHLRYCTFELPHFCVVAQNYVLPRAAHFTQRAIEHFFWEAASI